MRFVLIGGLLFVAMTSPAAQSLDFFELFTDHAVLQRGVEHPVWGQAEPHATVSLQFAGEVFNTSADRDGRWRLTLPVQAAGGPHELLLRSNGASLNLRDVYFGDVYLLSGQSNMEWRLRQSDPDGTRTERIADPMIRELRVAKTSSLVPQENLPLAYAWLPGTVEQIGEFSAVGSFFAHYLRAELAADVPIGLVHSSWGGSRIEAWMPAELLVNPVTSGDRPSEYEQLRREVLAFYREEFGQDPPGEVDRGAASGYLDPGTSADDWPTMELPVMWEAAGYPGVDGHFYFRRSFDLSAEQIAGPATLSLGAIDDSDRVYLNGELVGEMRQAWSEKRRYDIPAESLRTGQNTLIIWVEDTGGGGGFSGVAEEMYLQTAAGRVPLHGSWHYQLGSLRIDERVNQQPNLLYNAMIHPLAGLPLTGILWYQGESNSDPESARAYAEQFPAMIENWRAHFQRPDLPFYWVQLANFLAEQNDPGEEGWGLIRQSQSAALALPNTGQAVIYDLGEADDIHPRNKWEVGRRLARLALYDIYRHRELPARSPLAVSVAASRGRLFVQLNEGREPLKVRGDRYGYAKGFVVQDRAGRWHWAQARLYENGIEVYAVGVDDPVAVRYAYANNPSDANVYTESGLPLSPFSLKITD